MTGQHPCNVSIAAATATVVRRACKKIRRALLSSRLCCAELRQKARHVKPDGSSQVIKRLTERRWSQVCRSTSANPGCQSRKGEPFRNRYAEGDTPLDLTRVTAKLWRWIPRSRRACGVWCGDEEERRTVNGFFSIQAVMEWHELDMVWPRLNASVTAIVEVDGEYLSYFPSLHRILAKLAVIL